MNLYTIESSYAEDLRLKVDSRVPMVTAKKENRPFLGIVLTIDTLDYYVPLTSPKAKHAKMKDSADFILIDNGSLGALNLNNMIPVKLEFLNKIDLNLDKSDTKENQQYKSLLQKQKDWCNMTINKDMIIKKARSLYDKVINSKKIISELISKNKNPQQFQNLVARCCDFNELNNYISTKYKTASKLLQKNEINKNETFLITINKINNSVNKEDIGKIGLYVQADGKNIFKSITDEKNEIKATKELLDNFQKYQSKNSYIQEREVQHEFTLASNIANVNTLQSRQELERTYDFIKPISDKSKEQRAEVIKTNKENGEER